MKQLIAVVLLALTLGTSPAFPPFDDGGALLGFLEQERRVHLRLKMAALSRLLQRLEVERRQLEERLPPERRLCPVPEP